MNQNSRQWPARPGRHLGLCIGPDGITAVERRPGLLGSRPGATHQWSAEAGAAPVATLHAALEALAALSRPGTKIHVAVQRPFAQLKRLLLPALSRTELRRLVTKSAARFFVLGSAALGDASPLQAKRGRSRRPTLAAVADAGLVAAFESAATTHGFKIGSICAAPIAAASGAGALTMPLRRGTVALLWLQGSSAELYVLRSGVLQVVRSLRVDGGGIESSTLRSTLAEVEATYGLTVGRVVLGGADATRYEAEPTARTGEVLSLVTPPALSGLRLEELAAFGSTLVPSGLPRFQSEQRWRAWERAGARQVIGMSAGAAAMAVLAAGFHLVDLQEELAAVERQRAALEPAVEDARKARAAVTAVEDRVLAFEAVEAGSIAWTAVIAGIADALPADAHLSVLRTEGSLVRLEGRARSGARAVAALEGSPLLRDVRIVAPLQREETPDGVFERISLTAAIEMHGQAGAVSAPRPEQTP